MHRNNKRDFGKSEGRLIRMMFVNQIKPVPMYNPVAPEA